MILLVIDLQSMFVESIPCPIRRENVINRAIHEIQDARAAGETIIVLNYCDHGDTHPHIAAALQGYENHITIWKDSDDGSHMVDNYLQEVSERGAYIKVTGVNVMYCVGDTVKGLIRRKHKPLLLWGAVEDAWATRQEQREWIQNENLFCRWK